MLVLIGVGLTWLWGYAEAYEASQPTSTMDEVVAELNTYYRSFGVSEDNLVDVGDKPRQADTTLIPKGMNE